MARGDDDSSNRTRGRRKSPFPPLRLVQDLPDSDDAAPRSPSGAGKGVGGARTTGGRTTGSARASSHGQQVRGAKARTNELRAARSGERSQASSAQARKAHPAGAGQGSAASRNTPGRPGAKGTSQKAAGQKATGQKGSAQRGSNASARGAQRGTSRGGQNAGQARSSQGSSAQARPGQGHSGQGRSGQASNAQGRAQGRPTARTGQAGNAQRAAQSRSSQGHTSQGHSGQARSSQGRASQPRTSQGRSGQGRGGQGAASRTGAASTARRARAGGQQQNPRKQAQGAPGKRRVNAPGARPSRPQSQAPERRRPPANRPKKPPRQPMDPALKASLMRLGRNVFLVVLTVVLVVWGFNYVTETVRVQNLQAARQNQGSGMPTPLACDTKNLDVTITLPAQVARGQALTVNLKVANKANIPCIFDVGSEHLQMRVTSGTDTVYDAATCKVEPNSRKMLLAPLTAKAAGESAYVSANPTPDSFTTSVSWNGQRYKADCSSAGPSQAGTYVLRLNLDGKELVGQQVFIVK
ncbi:MAG: hypothetical protein HXK05_03085 [Actinomyces graevenitzii]|uniref:Uncharacterized protein n=1 Tax=Actinomyces graevenitzii TaxID=55565 RepID=A0A9E7AJW1_9ACTO|nr:hypothetical protein [Actinomyces graevenitzii]UQF80004.1 MAG: hypothetical protein M3I41_01630 [Actinomyces graevenitzii]